MAYITRAISRNEKLLAIARPHWIYVVKGLAWFFASIGVGIGLEQFLFWSYGHHALDFKVDLWIIHFDELFTPIPWLCGFLGIVMFWSYFVIYISHEVGLTDQRFIYKRGLFLVHLEQADLTDIRAEEVSHGLLGWLLRYGYVHLDCRFIDDLYFPAISQPYKLLRLSHVARMQHPDIDFGEENLAKKLKTIEKQEAASKTPPIMAELHDEILRIFKSKA